MNVFLVDKALVLSSVSLFTDCRRSNSDILSWYCMDLTLLLLSEVLREGGGGVAWVEAGVWLLS